MPTRLIRIGVIGLIAIGVATYVKMSRRSEMGDVARASAMEILSRVEGYEANQRFYDMHADLAHQAAMGEAYSMGGRRTRSTFDEGEYMNVFFGRLMTRARDDGKPEIVRAIAELCDEENITPAS